MELKPHQQRVIAERDEVSQRLGALYAFFQSDTFQGLLPVDQALLRNQARFMDGYVACLEDRIRRWEL